MGVINVAARAEPSKISEQIPYNNIDRDNRQGVSLIFTGPSQSPIDLWATSCLAAGSRGNTVTTRAYGGAGESALRRTHFSNREPAKAGCVHSQLYRVRRV